jgi:AcrR family transcriptional regulator
MNRRTDESVSRPRPRNRSERQVEESAELKARIVREAMAEFAEQGYAQTTLVDIGKRVGLSRPGILHHFPSKEALFREVLEELYRWGQRQIDQHLTGQGLPSVRELQAFLGPGSDTLIPLKLIHVLEGEAIAGNPIAQEYAARRAAAVRTEVLARNTRPPTA